MWFVSCLSRILSIHTGELLGGLTVERDVVDVVGDAAQGHQQLGDVCVIAEAVRVWHRIRVIVASINKRLHTQF